MTEETAKVPDLETEEEVVKGEILPGQNQFEKYQATWMSRKISEQGLVTLAEQLKQQGPDVVIKTLNELDPSTRQPYPNSPMHSSSFIQLNREEVVRGYAQGKTIDELAGLMKAPNKQEGIIKFLCAINAYLSQTNPVVYRK